MINEYQDIGIGGELYLSGTTTTDNTNTQILVRASDGQIKLRDSSTLGSSGATNSYWVSGTSGNFSIKTINDSGLNATGNYSLAEGYSTTAIGFASHAEGSGTTAQGTSSHSEGNGTIASGVQSHAEGLTTTSSNRASHAEGQLTVASGIIAHAEGFRTSAVGVSSHSEGSNTTASGNDSHSEGNFTVASGTESHAEGESTTASGSSSHSEGSFTTALGRYSHSGGILSIASGDTSFVHGNNSQANGVGTIVLGNNITGNTDNTTYVSNFNINTIGNTTSINNLGIDTNGNIVVGHSGDTYTTGFTYNSSNILTLTDNNGYSLSTTINEVSGLTISGSLIFTGTSGTTSSIVNSTNPIQIGSGNLFGTTYAVGYFDKLQLFLEYNDSATNTGSVINLAGSNGSGGDGFTSDSRFAEMLAFDFTTGEYGGFQIFPNVILTKTDNVGNAFSGIVYDKNYSHNYQPLSLVTYSDITGKTSANTYTTGGTYSAGTAVFTNNTGGTFSVTGFSTGSTTTSFKTTSVLSGSSAFTVTHNLNNRDVIVQVKDLTLNQLINVTIDNYQLNSVDITSTINVSSARIMILSI